MIGFAFLAGLLSILSPCVLPLVPIVLGTALSRHRLGPLALSLGLALSFTAIGLFVATIGFAIGLDGGVFETAAAIMLVLIGLVLLVPAFQARFAIASGPIGARAEARFGARANRSGLLGQFGVGLLLGAVWSPCAGPTLGAASLMAARAEHLGLVAATMLAYGIGPATPLLLIGLLSRETLARWRGGMLATGKGLKQAMGAGLMVLGLVMLIGWDKVLETKLVDASPAWMTALTTRF
jgi:cytochrome c biogenesis protein CcdA